MPDLRAMNAVAPAVIPYPMVTVPHASEGPLSGLCFAVKDVFDVAGYPTGGGTPILTALSKVTSTSAPVVQTLLDAGARFVGKVVSDEFAFSLDGMNAHYGAPLNVAAPDRITGGSSSGSAAVVACGLADFALGSDTGGSVRAPASHCGLFGMRPSHGRIGLAGMLELSPSFDTCGWFARDAHVLGRVADVLLDSPAEHVRPRLLWPVDLWRLLAPEPMLGALAAARQIAAISPSISELNVAMVSFDEMARHFRMILGREAWGLYGRLIECRGRPLSPAVAENFEWSRQVSAAQAAQAHRFRREFVDHLSDLLGHDGVLVMPTMPDVAPLRLASDSYLKAYRRSSLRMLCIASLAGAPQLTLPIAQRNGAPMGLSLLGPVGSDRVLVAAGQVLCVHQATPPSGNH